MDFVGAWNRLFTAFPPGVLLASSVIGVAIVVLFLAIWAIKGRKGSGISMKDFPWTMTIIGAALMGPQILVPAVLLLLQAFVIIVVGLITWGTGLIS